MPRENVDEQFMRAALSEARRSLGQTSPNPAVGAVLVVGERIVARGHHRRAGAAHAEVECLRQYGKRIPKNATMYVTLEPCSTSGKTGPCTDALIKAGLRKIVIGALDPNPRHSGRGIKLLTNAGLQVRTGVLAAECSELNEAFNKWIRTGRPFVIAKCGMSLDGRLTASPSEGRWLTSPASRRHAHRLRAQVARQREGGRIVSVAAIIAVACDAEGRREIVGLHIGPSEAETFWVDFLRRLKRRIQAARAAAEGHSGETG